MLVLLLDDDDDDDGDGDDEVNHVASLLRAEVVQSTGSCPA